MEKPLIILVDMDGVLADLEQEFLSRWQKEVSATNFISIKDRDSHKIADQYLRQGIIKRAEEVTHILQSPDFYRSLPPIQQGKETLEEMKRQGYIVKICTSPLSNYKNCVEAKYDWVNEHIGPSWTDHIILTRDKTMVQGDFLIDDKPDITGIIQEPTWEHILFEQSYNTSTTIPNRSWKRKITWDNWKSILP